MEGYDGGGGGGGDIDFNTHYGESAGFYYNIAQAG